MSYGIYLNQIPGIMYTTGSDSLQFQYVKDGRTYNIQTGHTTIDKLSALESWRSAVWMYKGETPEGVLVFEYNAPNPENLVDVEPMLHTLYPESFMWITPKGLPRPQPTLWAPLTAPAKRYAAEL